MISPEFEDLIELLECVLSSCDLVLMISQLDVWEGKTPALKYILCKKGRAYFDSYIVCVTLERVLVSNFNLLMVLVVV